VVSAPIQTTACWSLLLKTMLEVSYRTHTLVNHLQYPSFFILVSFLSNTQLTHPGLFIRRPAQDEQFANWEKSAAGLREDDDRWVYVPPVKGVHTVILGDMMQYLTRGYMVATPHKVGLNTRERFSFAYFHEPSFQAILEPLEGGCGGMAPESKESKKQGGIHYGTHFTNMFMRNYPDRITTKRLVAEDRYALLEREELRTMGSHVA